MSELETGIAIGRRLKPKNVFTFTHKGQRDDQEDYNLLDQEKGIYIVADGFGGPIPGAEAAKLACESVRNFLFREAGDLDATLPFVLRNYFSLAGNVLFNSLIHANRKLSAYNSNKNVNEKGGASVLACFIDEDLLAIANVGLCTAWLIRGEKAAELVIPRTFGKLSDPFASCPVPELQIPLIALGMTEDLEPEIMEYKVREGDWLVLQTDGAPTEMIKQLVDFKLKNQPPSSTLKDIEAFLKSPSLLFNDNAVISLVIF